MSIGSKNESLIEENASSERVSIVMAVYNDVSYVEQSVQSILAQQGVEWELILVDDGSNLKTKELLAKIAENDRVRLLTQDNQGITKALISGIRIASYSLIARLDVGDTMQATRLFEQASLFESDPSLSLVCSHVAQRTAEGYPLFDIVTSQEELDDGLLATSDQSISGPFHASTMFRKSDYVKVGGYRAEFYFAQDLDLWTRLIEVGEAKMISKPLTNGLFLETGMSATHAPEQQKLKRIIVRLKAARKNKESEAALLREAAMVQPHNIGSNRKRSLFAGRYFIARCLEKSAPAYAGTYYKRALAARPWSLIVLLRYSQWLCAQWLGKN